MREPMMCLGIPMKVVEIDSNNAVTESGGIRKAVRLDLLDDVKTGDYVLVHTGYAIEKLDPQEARETLELLKQVYEAGKPGRVEEENGS
jgi:hydrogenase expression/formation protein HypC